MALASVSAKAEASKNALLALKVGRAIHHATRQDLSEPEKLILERGAGLLSEIVQGSLLLKGGEAVRGLAPSEKGLQSFGHALSAAERIRLATEADQDLTALFLGLREEVLAIREGRLVPVERLQTLQGFFDYLASMFEQDIQDVGLARPRPVSAIA